MRVWGRKTFSPLKKGAGEKKAHGSEWGAEEKPPPPQKNEVFFKIFIA